MKRIAWPAAWLVALTALATAHARVVTVNTTNNLNPAGGQTSLWQALNGLQDGDEIRFNLPGAGPHFILTPPGGYPWITKHRVTIDGYSQPGAVPNRNPILAANNAQLQVVLDSRNGHFTPMAYAPDNPRAGYDDSEFAVLGVVGGTNVTIRGLSILGKVPAPGDPSHYGISFARDHVASAAHGHIAGCWIGVAPDGKTLSGTKYAITGFRHRLPDGTDPVVIENLTIGVGRASTNAPAEFNVIVQSAIPIIVEGRGTRISGNFIGVLPDGLHDVNVALDPAYSGDFQFEGAIELGRNNDNSLIGTDGDGVNDAHERNVIGGTLPPLANGYDHTIEFYGNAPGTNIVIAGNYVGVGIDGQTWFTNAVPAINAGGGSAQYRIGSNFDGVSDELEGNLIVNYQPASDFPPAAFLDLVPNNLNFFDEISPGGIVALRGNRLVNNLPFPVSPLKYDGGVEGAWRTNYYAKALVDAPRGVEPVLATDSTYTRLIGTVPVADTNTYPTTILDVYVADPVGMQTGKDTGIPELPHGFVQGRAYLGSFVENGPADLNPALGAFEFDVTRLQLSGVPIAVTANYVRAGAGEAEPVVLTSPFSNPIVPSGAPPPVLRLTAVRTGNSLEISWPSQAGRTYQVQAATQLNEWRDAGTSLAGTGGTLKYTEALGGQARFYRVLFGGAIVRLVQADSGKTITLNSGDLLRVELTAATGTPYSWRKLAGDAAILVPVDTQFIPPPVTDPPTTGGRGTSVYYHQGSAPGQTLLKFGLGVAWMPNDPPAETFEVTVKVQ